MTKHGSCNVFELILLLSLLPLATCVLKWKPVAGRTAESLSERPCTDIELADYALLVSVGPAKQPMCKPALGQVLAASPSTGVALNTGLSQKSSSVKASSDVRPAEPVAKTAVHFVHLHVVQSDSSWCALPCDSPSWELAAPKPAVTSPYVLLEAAIWRQFRKVVLYRFDDKWEKLARNSYQGLCDGKSWGCEAYSKHRQSKALITIGPWPEALDMDGPALSAYLKDAFQKIFIKTQELAGGENSRIGLTYSGHGGDADGSLFAGVLDSADAISMLESRTEQKGKFSLFNFGTNCREGRWNMLAAMHPFADHILASDLNVGGLKASDEKEELKHVKAKEKLADVAVIKAGMEARFETEAVVKDIIKKRRELWLSAMKKDIKSQQLRQSIAAFVSNRFPDFAAALKAAYQKLPVDDKEQVKMKAEASECDVLTVIRYMDSASASFLQQINASSSRGARASSSSGKAGHLEKQFMAFRTEYASTQSLFAWKPPTHGLGFNFIGERNNQPTCDLEAALGKLGCGPVCKKEIADLEAEEQAAHELRRKQDAIVRKEFEKIMDAHDAAEEKRRKKMSAAARNREKERERKEVAAHTEGGA